MTGNFDGQVVFLTGAGSATGIGRATALAFARAGARIAANDVTTDDLAETVDLLRAAGAEAEAFQADVSQARCRPAGHRRRHGAIRADRHSRE